MARLRPDAIRVEMNERIELRIEPLNLRDVLVGELQRREVAAAEQRELFCSRKQSDGHGGEGRFYRVKDEAAMAEWRGRNRIIGRSAD